MEETTSEVTTRRPRRPSDYLDERRTLSRRLLAGSPAPSIKELARHAEKFGGEAVVETAVELGHSFDSCVRLQDSVDRLEALRYRRLHPHARPEKLHPSEERVRALMGLEREEKS